MSKHIVFPILLLVAFLFSCNKDESPEMVPVTLLTPLDGASINLADVNREYYIFEWENTDNLEKILVLSINENFANEFSVPAGKNGRVLVGASDLNFAVTELGGQAGVLTDIYWSIKSSVNSKIHKFRKFRITPKEQEKLMIPKNNSEIDLNNPLLNNKIVFQWNANSASNQTNVSLLFSISADGDSQQMLNISNTGEYIMSDIEFQKILNKLNVPPYSTSKIYWNVYNSTTSENISNTFNVITVSGKMVFIDTRGSEEIVYKVSQIKYSGGTSNVWLSENLRTRKYPNGSDIETTNMFFPNYYGNKISYYGIQYHFDIYRKLAPDGWRLPTVNEYKQLLIEAQKSQGGMPVIMSAKDWEGLLNRDNMDTWGIALVPSGRQERTDWTSNLYSGSGLWAAENEEWKCVLFDGGTTLYSSWTIGAAIRYIKEK